MSNPTPRLSRAHIALLVVCALHLLSPILLRGLHAGLGPDETVYISQINPHVPAGLFSAPRARGLTLLTAPAAYLSPSLAVMRAWLALLSGVGLYLAFVPWLRLRRGWVVPVAAALWSCLWTSIYYGFEAMPNQYVAYGAVAGAGWLMLSLQQPERRRYLLYLAIDLAVTALMRPTDATFLLIALVACTLVMRATPLMRRFVISSVMATGLLAGLAEWIVEAYVRFGSPAHRFHAASAENTGGLHWSLGAQMRTLAGPTLCRTGCDVSSSMSSRVWWFALVPLVIFGVAVAYRKQRSTMYVVAIVAGLAIASEYIVGIGYAAPRFLEPAYALLALPVAEGLVCLASRARPVLTPIAITGVTMAFLAQIVGQSDIVHHLDQAVDIRTARDAGIAASLNQAGVPRGHCTIGGVDAATIAFLAGCTNTPNTRTYVPPQRELASRTMAFIGSHEPADPTYYSAWPKYLIRGTVVGNGLQVWILRKPTITFNDQVTRGV